MWIWKLSVKIRIFLEKVHADSRRATGPQAGSAAGDTEIPPLGAHVEDHLVGSDTCLLHAIDVRVLFNNLREILIGLRGIPLVDGDHRVEPYRRDDRRRPETSRP